MYVYMYFSTSIRPFRSNPTQQTNQLNYNQNRFARSKINENKGAYD